MFRELASKDAHVGVAVAGKLHLIRTNVNGRKKGANDAGASVSSYCQAGQPIPSPTS